MPAYLTALGASGVVVGLFGSAKDLLDSLYQYPGGWLADRFGRRRALMVFTVVALAGYLTYALAPAWPMVFAGLVGVMAWKAGAFPTTFAVIGDSLPRERRALAFSVQSVLVRVPRVIGAPLGGMLIASAGMLAGFRTAVAITVALAVAVLGLQYFGFREPAAAAAVVPAASRRGIRAGIPRPLAQLLVADCLVRIGEGIAASFIVLYVTSLKGFSLTQFGVLYAVQQSVAIASYLPGGRVADATGRRPLVVTTFVFFALFPLAVRLAPGYGLMLAAFAVGGLKEVGEPARKSLIVDLAPDDRRARTVGLYYTVRNLLIVPAGLIGGLLWQVRPGLPLEVAALVSATGVVAFLLMRD